VLLVFAAAGAAAAVCGMQLKLAASLKIDDVI